jgi:pilus assembly protein CpaC
MGGRSIGRSFGVVLAAAICMLPALPAQMKRPPAAAGLSRGTRSVKELAVGVGETKLVDCDGPIVRIAVGAAEIATATATTPTEVLVSGKTPGQTSLILWERGGARELITITVRASGYREADQVDAVRRELKQDLMGQEILVDTEQGALFLRGTAKDLNSSQRAVQIASAISSSKVVNLLDVKVPPAEPQILLKVIFASVDRSLSNQLGINLFTTGTGGVVGGTSTGQFSPPTVSLPSVGVPAAAAISEGLNLLAFLPGQNIGATIQALESRGLVQVLSEPNILAQNGKEGSFLAGGEYPYPVAQGAGVAGTTITIMFKEYGIRLNFIPTITPRGTILLQVAPEVSSLDFTNAIEISGFQVPAIDVRKVNTEVELGDGQSFVIGGLLDNRETETFQKIPFLGDVPVLGKFFQSIAKTKTNTELIVIVTPEIVDPIPAGDGLPHLKYPATFLESNSKVPMHTPESKGKASPVPQAPQTVPVEQLMKSMQQERPLVIDNTSSGSFGSGGSSAPQ